MKVAQLSWEHATCYIAVRDRVRHLLKLTGRKKRILARIGSGMATTPQVTELPANIRFNLGIPKRQPVNPIYCPKLENRNGAKYPCGAGGREGPA